MTEKQLDQEVKLEIGYKEKHQRLQARFFNLYLMEEFSFNDLGFYLGTMIAAVAQERWSSSVHKLVPELAQTLLGIY